ncbi:MAG: ferredoxin/flavodoxin---NADP+ reductase [Kosmotogales bacterium]|nr:ferredoxin/flavodoxin---NADP+ reductase [Kosmotogales bacterium]
MNEIIEINCIANLTYEIIFCNGEICENSKPGQFLILQKDEFSERVPLTIVNCEDGKVRVIIKVVGRSSLEISEMKVGDSFKNVVGPLGNHSEIRKYGNIVCIGGGVGAAPLLPVTRELKKTGNKIISILGAADANSLILDDEFEKISEKLYITTNDGSKGKKGFVTDILKELLKEKKVDIIWAIGPMIMMREVTKLSVENAVPCWVSLNPIMVDGTGMCGACRVHIKNEIKFACVDGPEFSGADVNWDELISRLSQYRDQEKSATEYKCRCDSNAK